jgi:hypothetical protein
MVLVERKERNKKNNQHSIFSLILPLGILGPPPSLPDVAPATICGCEEGGCPYVICKLLYM